VLLRRGLDADAVKALEKIQHRTVLVVEEPT
jgi:hypothetical protein